MARHKPNAADLHVTDGGQPSTSTEETANVPHTSYPNGPLPDHLSISKALASKKAVGWAKTNWLTLASVAIAAGALWLLPVTRWQLDDAKRDINEKISAVQTKVEDHDNAISEMKSSIARVEDNTTKILFKLSDRPTAEKSLAVPASFPPPEKPRPKPKRPHPQRIGLAKILGIH